MHPDVILTALRHQPFAPFRLHVLDGASYDVRHPEFLWLAQRTAYLGIPDATESALPERPVMIAVAHGLNAATIQDGDFCRSARS